MGCREGPSKRAVSTSFIENCLEGRLEGLSRGLYRGTVSRNRLEGPSRGAVSRSRSPELGVSTARVRVCPKPASRVCRVCAFWPTRFPVGLAVARTRTRPFLRRVWPLD